VCVLTRSDSEADDQRTSPVLKRSRQGDPDASTTTRRTSPRKKDSGARNANKLEPNSESEAALEQKLKNVFVLLTKACNLTHTRLGSGSGICTRLSPFTGNVLYRFPVKFLLVLERTAVVLVCSA